MFSKYIVPALAATNLLNGVEASSRHRHMHKRDVVYAATEVDYTTVYETVYVTAGDEATAAAAPAATSAQAFYAAGHKHSHSLQVSSASSTTTEAAAPAAATSTSSSIYIAAAEPSAATSATTLATVVQSIPAAVVQPDTASVVETTPVPTTYAAAPTTTAAAAASTTTKAASTGSSSSSGGARRGLGYNDATLVSTIVSAASTTFGWCYDWGFTNGGLTASLAYIPMLWGPSHYNSAWDAAASAAVAGGTEALFSFNECDNAGQANLDAATAAKYHQQYLGPYKGQIKIGSPSITSSTTTGQGLSWLSDFMAACGKECAVDFVNVHWYGPGGSDGGQIFLDYLVEAHTQTGYNLWVTEFGVVSGDENAFLTYVLDKLDNDSTYSFVDKYAYFYLASGYLMSSATSLSSAGTIYAAAS